MLPPAKSKTGRARVDIGRRMIIGGAAALAASPPIGAVALREAGAAPANPYAALLGPDRRTIKIVQVSKGDDGQAKIADMQVQGEPLAKTELVQFLARKATKVAVYSAPAGHAAFREASGDGAELLYVIKGALTLSTGATKRRCGTGSLILVENGAAHGEDAGDKGYSAIRIKLAEEHA